MWLEVGVALGALAISAVSTGIIRKLAISHGVLDVPNARSSHTQATPRGGGLAIVIATSLSVVALYLGEILEGPTALALAGGLAVAAIGFIDDRYTISAKVRLIIHFAAGLWALVCLGGLPALQLGEYVLQWGVAGYFVGAVGIVWVLNLFNFMDGIDGLAAAEAVYIGAAAALLISLSGGQLGIAPVSLAFAGACCGFLFWNWPPARIFMGDVGSGYLGYVVAVLAVSSGREHGTAVLAWLILGGVFFVDATVTFSRRLLRGEAVHVAHRSHAYQRLSRIWQSHLRVTLLLCTLNVLWLLPWALVAIVYPRYAGWAALVSLLPLVWGVFRQGAGTPEAP